MQAVALPDTVGQMYIHPVYKKTYNQEVTKTLLERRVIPSKQHVVHSLSPIELKICRSNALILNNFLSKAPDRNKFLYNFLLEVAHDRKKLRLRIACAVYADVDQKLLSDNVHLIYLSRLMVAYFDQLDETTIN